MSASVARRKSCRFIAANIELSVTHLLRSMRNVCVATGCPSVCLFVYPVNRHQQQHVAGLLHPSQVNFSRLH